MDSSYVSNEGFFLPIKVTRAESYQFTSSTIHRLFTRCHFCRSCPLSSLMAVVIFTVHGRCHF